MPRGFLGGTGELDEVELVIVLAEPGDPKGTEMYADGLAPSDTGRCVVDFVHQTYANREERRVHGNMMNLWRARRAPLVGLFGLLWCSRKNIYLFLSVS